MYGKVKILSLVPNAPEKNHLVELSVKGNKILT